DQPGGPDASAGREGERSGRNIRRSFQRGQSAGRWNGGAVNDWIIGATGAGPLLDELHVQLPGTEGVVLLSADGVELATSAGTRPESAARLSAVAAGLHAIAGAADRLNGGR